MKGEFRRVLTSDGLELQGILATPEGGPSDTSLLHVHGLAGNFYENRFVDDVAAAVTSCGINFLTVNNRGHDYISDFIIEEGDGASGSVQIGGIYEIFEDCVKDIAAWVDLLRSRGSKRIILQGHSHGALKVTYYFFREGNPCGAAGPDRAAGRGNGPGSGKVSGCYRAGDSDIAGIVLLSPSDDFGCQRERVGEAFDEAVGVAREMVDRGSARDLLPPGYFHYPVSAQTFLDIFTDDSALGMFNLSETDRKHFAEIESVTVPVLAIVGSVDEAFLGSPAAYLGSLKARLKNAPGFEGHVIDGAPHNYQGFDAEVARHIGGWLKSKFRS
jgi:pimeloyl-ACP methyl ester carboxylesterase